MKKIVERYALQNAIQYGGKAKVDSVLGKILAERPELRKNIKELKFKVLEVIGEVNELSLEEQRKKLKKIAPELLKPKKKEEKRELPKLSKAKEKKVVTRFAPEPGGAIHIGNLRAAILSYLYAKKYDGELILRFEDSNPRKSKLRFYDWVREDLRKLGIEWDKEVIESDHLEEYYKYAKQILEKEKAYVCTCSQSKFQDLKRKKKKCPCRDLPKGENLKRWRDMLEGKYKEGEAAVRLKTSMKHPNPALRDPPLLRIVDHTHPRVGDKYRVYPLYNFACALEDHWSGVTHVLRGKEFEHGAKIQKKIYQFFGWKAPVTIQYGRLIVKGPIKLGKRYIRKGLKEGTLSGWDDVRLATVRALLRRGIQPEALKRYFKDIGPSKVDIELDWDQLYSYNKEVIDPKSNRYFFVWNPVRLIVKNPPFIDTVQIKRHPDYPDRGKRKLKLKYQDENAAFYITEQDKKDLKKGGSVRLMHLYNIEVEDINEKVKASFQSKGIKKAREKGLDLVHWLPASSDLVSLKLLMPDGSIKKGFVEPEVKRLKVGEMIQLVRVGFGRIDKKTDRGIIVCFTHR